MPKQRPAQLTLGAEYVVPPPLNTPEFLAWWDKWMDYRRGRRLPILQPCSIELQMDELAGWGEPVAIAAIKQSIRQGYQGIFYPKDRLTGGKAAPAPVAARPPTVWELREREKAILDRLRALNDGREGQRYVGMKPGKTSAYEWTPEGLAERSRLHDALRTVRAALAETHEAA